MKKGKYFWGLLLLLSAGKLVSDHGYELRSRLILYPYSRYQYEKSALAPQGIDVRFPPVGKKSHEAWYPRLLTFADDPGFSRYSGQEVSYTVFYGFPAFPAGERGSAYYQADSPFHGSFYGAYLVQNTGNNRTPYGFSEEGVDVEQLRLLAAYDQLYLVLPSLGCPAPDRTFSILSAELTPGLFYGGTSGWTRIDGLLETNSPLHQYKGHQTGYLQYGLPPSDYSGTDFPPLTMTGRMYVKHFAEANTTVVFYLIGTSQEFVDYWDDNLLATGVVEWGHNESLPVKNQSYPDRPHGAYFDSAR